MAAVEDDAQRFSDLREQLGVGVGGFAFRPVPCDDVVIAGRDEQAASGGVGAVDEDLVVDAVRFTIVGYIDEPKWRESAI